MYQNGRMTSDPTVDFQTTSDPTTDFQTTSDPTADFRSTSEALLKHHTTGRANMSAEDYYSLPQANWVVDRLWMHSSWTSLF